MKKSYLFVLVVLIELLLAGCNNDPAHVHEWGEWETVIEATCTKDGVAARKCKTCGDLDKETKAVKASGHSWDDGKVTKVATCSAEGVKTFTCSSCKETKTETVGKLAHTYGEVETTEATCDKDGEKYRTCSVCGDRKVDETITKLGHSWGEGAVTSESTCSAEGTRTFTCSRCSGTRAEAITKKDHTYGELQTKAATCKEDGKKYKICSVCNDEKVEEVIPKSTEHTWGDGVETTPATCGAKGVKTFTCSVCNDTKTEDIPATGAHTYGDEKTQAATCALEGKTYQVCSVCGNEKVNSTIPKLEHTWNAGVVTTEPTCAATGIRTYTCSVCGDSSRTESVPVDSSKHTYTWVTDTAATFINPKTEKGTCSICHNETTRTTDEYKSIKGYWKAEVPSEMGMEDLCWYFSFGEDSSTAVDVDFVMPYNEEITIGQRYDDTYSWTVDSSTGKRSKFTWISAVMDSIAAATSAETIKKDETTKDTITLVISIPGGPSGSTSCNLVLERISEDSHEHAFGDAPEYKPFEDIPNCHTAPTKCEGNLHPAFDCIFEHRFNSTSETPEICLDCRAEKTYKIEIRKGDESGYSTVEQIYVTKSKGFTPGDTYTSEEGGITYTGITEWKNKTTGESYTIGEKITPSDNSMVLVFTTGSSKTGE